MPTSTIIRYYPQHPMHFIFDVLVATSMRMSGRDVDDVEVVSKPYALCVTRCDAFRNAHLKSWTGHASRSARTTAPSVAATSVPPRRPSSPASGDSSSFDRNSFHLVHRKPLHARRRREIDKSTAPRSILPEPRNRCERRVLVHFLSVLLMKSALSVVTRVTV